METMICRCCGRELPLSEFQMNGKYRLYKCRKCTSEYKKQWLKARGDKLFAETGYRRTQKEIDSANERSRQRRADAKKKTGKTYLTESEAERQRSYARKYHQNRKDDEEYKQRHKELARRSYMLRKIRESEDFLNKTNLSEI